MALYVLTPARPDFLAQYPEIQIDLGVSDQHIDLIGSNVDCVIRGGPLSDSSMVARKLGTTSWVTCATPAYLAKHGTPRHPRDLEEGHVTVSYLSSKTALAVPMIFRRRGVRVEPHAAPRAGL